MSVSATGEITCFKGRKVAEIAFIQDATEMERNAVLSSLSMCDELAEDIRVAVTSYCLVPDRCKHFVEDGCGGVACMSNRNCIMKRLMVDYAKYDSARRGLNG